MQKLDWWAERECAGHRRLLALSVHRQPLAGAAARERAARAGPRGRRRLGGAPRVRGERARGARRRPLELLPRPRRDPADRARLADRPSARRGPAARCSTTSEWEWLEAHLDGDFDHLLIGTSDPLVLAPALHYAERWGEARRARRLGSDRRAPRREAAPSRRPRPLAGLRRLVRAAHRPARAGGGGRVRQPAGVDHGALGRRPPRLSRRARLPALGEACAATSGRPSARRFATRSTTASARRSTSATRGARRMAFQALARLAGVKPRARALAPGRGPVLRQPGRDADDRRPRRRAEARAHGRRSRDRPPRAHTSFERSLA